MSGSKSALDPADWSCGARSLTAGGPTSATLIEGGIRDEETGRYVVEINPKLAKFFGPTQLDADRLGATAAAYAASPWRCGCTASTPATPRPHPLRVEPTCTRLSGSQTKQLRYFKKNLTQALRDLEAAGAIKSFDIRERLGSTFGPCRARASGSTWLHAGPQLAGGNRHGSTEPRRHGSTEPRRHGSTEPRRHGSLSHDNARCKSSKPIVFSRTYKIGQNPLIIF